MACDSRRHRVRVKLTAGFFLAYLCLAAVFEYMPYPFFDWELFSASPRVSSLYEIQVTALQPDRKLDTPIPLARLSPEFHRNWTPTPYTLVQRAGWLLDDHAWTGDLPVAERHIRDYYTGGSRLLTVRRAPEDLVLYRKLIENYFRDLPYVEYQLVRIRYDIVEYWRTGKPISVETIATFRKTGAPS